jgi:Asp-tRNA(Asn)/Glu-tRNA(Gln) amidotransferase C subunit
MEPVRSDVLDQLARRSGLKLTPAELEVLVPIIGRALETIERLESLPLAGIEPATQYRIL